MSHTRSRRDHTVALWTAFAVTVLWSSSWVLIRFVLDDEDLEPLTFAGLRYGLAAAVVAGAVAVRSDRRAEVSSLGRRSIGRLAILGVVFYAVTQGAQFVAIDSQPAATTSFVLSLTPLVVALASARSLGETPGPSQIVGGVLVVAGALLFFAGDLGATTVGMIAALVGLAANVTGGLLGRQVNRRHTTSPLVVTAVSMSIGAGLLLATGLLIEGVPDLTARTVVIIAWLAVVNTALAFTMWNAALRHLSAVESAGINNTMLIQIAVLAWVFLGEFPGPVGLVGIVVVSAGVFLTQAQRS
ncbi:MAG: DMT family transporter [Actinomycetota bacterium]